MYDAVMNAAKLPTPADVEAVAREYHDLDLEIEKIAAKAAEDMAPKQTRLDELKTWLVGNVREWGSSHAEKSKILHGIEFEAMVTLGQSSSIDAAAVETFRLALVKADKPHLLKQLFQKTIRWTLDANAAGFIRKNSNLLGSSKLMALYAQCTVTKDKAPQLTVREKQKS